MRIWIWAAALAVIACLGVAPAFADDWTAVKLRGAVLELVDGEWQPLERGDVVSDARLIKTSNNARVTFARGEELIELGPSTQIQIMDESGRRSFTTVRQYVGTVEIEADVQKVQHFAVTTPYLVAIVKGTRFVVTTSSSHTSKVLVSRGAVSVVGVESATETLIGAGQSASTRGNAPLRVSGTGELPEVIAVDANATEQLGIDLGNGNGTGNGNGNGGGNGNGLSLGNGHGVGVGNGRGNGNANGQGNRNGNGVSVDVSVGNNASIGVEVGNGNGVSVGVSLGGVQIGLGVGG